MEYDIETMTIEDIYLMIDRGELDLLTDDYEEVTYD